MHDVARVHVGQREHHLPADAPDPIERQRRASLLLEDALERGPGDVLEDCVGHLDGRPVRRIGDRVLRVIEVADDERVGAAGLTEHLEDRRFSLEAAHRLGRHHVRPQDLHDDAVAVGLVPRRGEDPALPALADALADEVARPLRPAQDLPGKQVTQRQRARVGDRHPSMLPEGAEPQTPTSLSRVSLFVTPT